VGIAIALILALLTALIGPHFVHWNDHPRLFEAEATRLSAAGQSQWHIDAKLLPVSAVTLGSIAIGPAARRADAAGSLRIELGLGR